MSAPLLGFYSRQLTKGMTMADTDIDTDIELRNASGWDYVLANAQSCDPQQLPDLLSRVLDLASQVKKFKSDLEHHFIERLEQMPGRSLTHGPLRYYIGTKTHVSCCDKTQVIEDVLTNKGGDIGALAVTLVKEPFKSAARHISPDNFQTHHRSSVEIKLVPLNYTPHPTKKGTDDERKEKD
jgi:hypothetical protein